MGRNFYDGTDAQLQTGAAAFAAQVTTLTAANFGLSEDQANDFKDAQLAYGAAYPAAVNPLTRTRGQVAAKNAARAALRAVAADLNSVINGTPSVTDQQKIDLGLNVRKAPSPRPRPTDSPGVDVVSSVGRTVTVRIHDGGSSTRRGKAPGAAAAWVYSFVGENYPADPEAWDFCGAATRGRFEITFASDLPGGTQVWVSAAWVNAKQEAGPSSAPISTTLQGGGSTAATPMSAMKIAA